MPGAHRDGDARYCDAKTIASDAGVYVNGKLWSVDGDPEDHGNGQLYPVVGFTVFVGGKNVIVAVGDKAKPDDFGHPDPPTDPKESSGDVFAYG